MLEGITNLINEIFSDLGGNIVKLIFLPYEYIQKIPYLIRLIIFIFIGILGFLALYKAWKEKDRWKERIIE